MYYVYILITMLYWCNAGFAAQGTPISQQASQFLAGLTPSSSKEVNSLLIPSSKYKYQPIMNAILTNLSTINSSIPRGLIPLDTYNQHRQSYGMTKVNYFLIKNFLDQELQLRCINPETVTYLVATGLTGIIFEQDWQFIKLSNGYGLVIPEDMPTIINEAQRLFGFTKELEPAFHLNIKNLSDLLSHPHAEKNPSELAQYRLAITKAIVKTISQSGTETFVQLCKESAWAYATEYSAIISQQLSTALMAIQFIYGQLSELNASAKFQKDLDAYILKSLDAELIQAHIEDLEQQFAATKGSYISQIFSYLPIPQDQLEQRIDVFKKYLEEIKDSFEAQMLPRFLKNKK